MSTVQNDVTTKTDTDFETDVPRDFGAEIRQNTCAVMLCSSKLRMTKAFTSAQKAKSADAFDADSSAVSGSKKLFNSRHPTLAAITKCQNRCRDFVCAITIDHPRNGIRLVRRDRVVELNEGVVEFIVELEHLIETANEAYQEMRTERQQALQELFNEADYPATLLREWSLSLEFPSVEPDRSMEHLHPEIYEEQKRRVAAQFDQVVRDATSAFEGEFEKLLKSLIDGMSTKVNAEGVERKGHFHKASIDKLKGFFDSFEQLNIGNNQALEELIGQAGAIVEGIDVEDIRTNVVERQAMAQQMGELRENLIAQMVDKPSRLITIEDEDE